MDNHAGADLRGVLDPSRGAPASYEEGVQYLKQGDPTQAIASFSMALELDSRPVRYHVGHVWASWSGNAVRSEICRRRLLSLMERVDEDDVLLKGMIHGLLGRLEAAMNNKAEARAHYKSAAAFNPDWEADLLEPARSGEEGPSLAPEASGASSLLARLMSRFSKK